MADKSREDKAISAAIGAMKEKDEIIKKLKAENVKLKEDKRKLLQELVKAKKEASEEVLGPPDIF